MECGKTLKKLGFHLDGALDEQSLEEVETHLAHCDACRQELAAMKMLVEAARDIELVDPPTGLRKKIVQAIESEKRTAQPLAKVLPSINLTAWLGNYASPASLRWAAGVVAAGTIALIVMVGTPHNPMQVEQASVRTERPAKFVAPAVPSKPSLTISASSPVSKSLEQKQSTVQQPQTARLAYARHRKRVFKSRLVAGKSITHKKISAVVAQVNAQPKQIKDVPPVDVNNTEATEVALSEPAVSAKTDVDEPVVVKVAAAPVLHHDKIREWMDNAKTQAEMKRPGDRFVSVSIVTARF